MEMRMDHVDGLCRKRHYQVMVQRAYADKEYNVPGRPGIVYNFFEDAYISVEGMAYVMTGTAGEMWPIPEERLEAYEAEGLDIGETPQPVFTKKSEVRYEYMHVPLEEKGEVTLANGSVLQVNSGKEDHGSGDMLLRPEGEEDCWVVNGIIFERTYERI